MDDVCGAKEERRSKGQNVHRIDGAWDKAVALVENGGSDGIESSLARNDAAGNV